MLWDSQKATLVLAGSAETPEAAAHLYDVYSLAYGGIQTANTNFRPSSALKQVRHIPASPLPRTVGPSTSLA
jgi:hypothetical protein